MKLPSKRVLYSHKITIKDWDNLYNKQNGLCAICGQELKTLKSRSIHIDHDHKTGKIRGLLCGNCNHLLGQTDENLYVLQNAIKYLLLYE